MSEAELDRRWAKAFGGPPCPPRPKGSLGIPGGSRPVTPAEEALAEVEAIRQGTPGPASPE